MKKENTMKTGNMTVLEKMKRVMKLIKARKVKTRGGEKEGERKQEKFRVVFILKQFR